MARYLTVRLLYGVITVTLVVVLTFVVQYLLPGDPARSIAGPRASAAVLTHIRDQLHLNDSLISQLWHYLTSVLSGNLGESYSHKQPVLTVILQRLPATLELVAAAMLLEVLIGGALGVWEAVREKRSWPIAAISVSGPAERVSPQFERIGTLVAETARAISARLGYVEHV